MPIIKWSKFTKSVSQSKDTYELESRKDLSLTLSKKRDYPLDNLDKNNIKKRKLYIKPPFFMKHEYSEKESFKNMTSSGRNRLERYRGAFQYLYSTGVKLGYMQKKLVDAIGAAFLKTMFGDDLINNLNFLKTAFGVDELFENLSCTFPRRSGKTIALAICAAVIMVSQEEGNVNCYNLTGRQSRDFLEQTIKYLCIFKDSPDFGWTEAGQDIREHIKIKTRHFNSINILHSYSSGLKGKATIGLFFIFSSLLRDRGFFREKNSLSKFLT